jgi:hypothetical protein
VVAIVERGPGGSGPTGVELASAAPADTTPASAQTTVERTALHMESASWVRGKGGGSRGGAQLFLRSFLRAFSIASRFAF